MAFLRELLQRVLPLVFVLGFSLTPTQYAHRSGCMRASSNEGQQIAKVLSVRKVLRNQYFVSRYPQIHYYMLYISLRISDQAYCAEYETPVLDEIDDVLSASGKDVEVVLKDKKIILRTPKGRKLKARVVEGKQC